MEYGDNLFNLITKQKKEGTLDIELVQIINEAAMIISSDTSGYNVEKVTGVDHSLLYSYRNNKRSLETMQLGTIMRLASFPSENFNENSYNIIRKLNKIHKSSLFNRPILLSKLTGVKRNQFFHLSSRNNIMTMNLLTALKIIGLYNSYKGTPMEF